MSQTYTVKQIAEILGYSTNSIYTFLKQGRIKGIRVGQGRFRITEEELRRVLHLSKKSTPTPVPVPSSAEEKIEEIAIAGVDHLVYKPFQLKATNLFHWFIGIVSVVVGFSMVLYNKYLSAPAAVFFLSWILPLQITFISAGLGILISELFEKKNSNFWSRIFQILLTIGYFLAALAKLKVGDAGGGVIFGLAFLTLIVYRLGLVEEIGPFLIFISGHSLIVPLLAFYNFEILDLPTPIKRLFSENQFLPFIWFLVAFLGVGLLWRFHRQNRMFYWLLMGIFGIVYFIAAFFAVNHLSWCKGFFNLIVGLFCLVLPAWETLHLSDHREKRIIFPLLVGILTLLILSISVIWVMETNIKDYAYKEIINKTQFGRNLVETAVNQLQTMVVGFEKNHELAELIEKKDSSGLKSFLKPLFQTSQFTRRFLIISSSGELLTIYPHQQLTTTNLAFRDYFLKAIAGELYFSQGFEAKVTDRRLVVVVSGPVRDENNKIIGVAVVSLDLKRLQNKLQVMALEKNQEKFYLIDKNGKYIIHPNDNFLGKNADGIELDKNQQYDFEGKLTLQDFTRLKEIDWLIGLRAPVEMVLTPTRAVTIILFLLIAVIVFFASLTLVVIKIKTLSG